MLTEGNRCEDSIHMVGLGAVDIVRPRAAQCSRATMSERDVHYKYLCGLNISNHFMLDNNILGPEFPAIVPLRNEESARRNRLEARVAPVADLRLGRSRERR